MYIQGRNSAGTLIGDPIVTFVDNGKVGIGTTNPSTTLQVNGSVAATAFVGDGSGLTNISGTADNDWTESGSNVYRSSGYVGIGTTSPSVQLEVSGSGSQQIWVSSSSDFANIKLKGGGSAPYDYSCIELASDESPEKEWHITHRKNIANALLFNYLDGTSWTIPVLALMPSGNVGIGTSSPASKLDVSGTVTATAFVGDGSGLTNVSGSTDNDWTISGNDMYAGISGNVGIGTSSPIEKFHIVGTGADPLHIESNAATYTGIDLKNTHSDSMGNAVSWSVLMGTKKTGGYDGLPAASFAIREHYDGANYYRFAIDDTGNVGIGTTNPSTKLDVKGTVTAIAFVGDGSGLTNVSGSADNDWMISGNDMYSGVSGNIGIGTTAPSGKLHIYDSVSGGQGACIWHVNNASASTDNIVRYVQMLNTSSTSRAVFEIDSRYADITDSSRKSFVRLQIADNGDFKTGMTFLGANIGIGTETPNDSLTVTGSMSVDSPTFYVDAINNRIGIGTPTPVYDLDVARDASGEDLVMRVRNTSTSDANSHARIQANTSTGGGDAVLGLGLTGLTGWYIYADRSTGGHLNIGRTGGSYSTVGSKLTMDLDGNVGIGTTSPSTKLYVNGTVTATTFVGDGAGLTNISGTADNDWTISGSNIYRNSGNVGIGTTNPERSLHIVTKSDGDGIQIDGSYIGGVSKAPGIVFYDQDTMIASIGAAVKHQNWTASSYAGDLIITATNDLFLTSKMIVKSSGYVGIGTTNPSYPLQMASGAYVTTGGVWTNASSRDYKENIQSLDSTEALTTLEQLNPVRYNYKNERDEEYLGFIAEEVPELVASKDRKGMSSMDIITVLTKVLQEKVKQIDTQQKMIEGLNQRLNALENKQ